MLTASDLLTIGANAVKSANKHLDGENILAAELAAMRAAIYTVGAEIVGRIDNMHFTGNIDNMRAGDPQFYLSGKIRIGDEDARERKQSDSNNNEKGTSPTNGAKGD